MPNRPVHASAAFTRPPVENGSCTSVSRALTTLHSLIADAIDAIESAEHAAIMIGTDQHPAAASDDTARLLDTYQRVTCDGPSLDAYRSGEVVRLFCSEPDRWKALRMVCEWHQIHSVASFPITDDVGNVLAVLTIYSPDHHAFGANEIRAARRLIDQISSADIIAA